MSPEIRLKYGIKPKARLYLEEGKDSFLLLAPASRLRRIYVEPTNKCNLNCATCIRHVWEEPLSDMTEGTYQKVLDTLSEYEPTPEVFFAGFGEPLSHPNIVEMIRQAKDRGARVELITNGTLLKEEMLWNLIKAGLDQLWVSIDGATPESYADVRLGNRLPKILENLRNLQFIKHRNVLTTPELGITFVAMKRNVADLPKIVDLASDLGASQLMISNVLPYSENMKDELLYQRSMSAWRYPEVSVQFPRMDTNELTWPGIYKLLKKHDLREIAGNEFMKPWETCPFIDKGSTYIRHDGLVSPCMPLLHHHTSFLEDRQRTIYEHFFGSLKERPLLDVWNSPDYETFRELVKQYDFSPCTVCNTCEYADSNEEDCIGSVPISCGGCLWGQGFVQCP